MFEVMLDTSCFRHPRCADDDDGVGHSVEFFGFRDAANVTQARETEGILVT